MNWNHTDHIKLWSFSDTGRKCRSFSMYKLEAVAYMISEKNPTIFAVYGYSFGMNEILYWKLLRKYLVEIFAVVVLYFKRTEKQKHHSTLVQTSLRSNSAACIHTRWAKLWSRLLKASNSKF